MGKNLAPIVLFVYNRPWHTRKTLEALSINEFADHSQLFIYADGPKADSTSENLRNIEEVRKIIREKDWCKYVEIIERDKNLGLEDSVIQGVTKVLKANQKIIVLEDDIITTRGFLKYMNEVLTTYHLCRKVFGVSGYRYPIKSEHIVKNNHFFLPISSSWGWGTWKDRWGSVNFNIEELDEQLMYQHLISRFSFGNHNFYEMFKGQKLGLIHSWAIGFYANMFLQDKYFIYPKYSLVSNIGFGSQSTHTKGTFDSYKSILVDQIEILRQNPYLDTQLVKEVSDHKIGHSSIGTKIKNALSDLFK